MPNLIEIGHEHWIAAANIDAVQKVAEGRIYLWMAGQNKALEYRDGTVSSLLAMLPATVTASLFRISADHYVRLDAINTVQTNGKRMMLTLRSSCVMPLHPAGIYELEQALSGVQEPAKGERKIA